MRWIRRFIMLALLIVVGSAAAYVRSDGFSRKWRSFVMQQFESRGVYLTLDKLTLDPLEGLVARGIKVYQDKRYKVLLADVDRLHLDLDYSKMMKDELFLEGLDLRDADLSFPLDPEDPTSEKLTIKALDARLYLIGDRIEIRRAEGTLFGLRVHLSGSLIRPPSEKEPEDERQVEERKRKRLAAIKARRNLIVEAARLLKHFESADVPRLEVEVNGDLEHPEELNATMRLTAQNLRHGDYLCEQLEAVASYAGEQVDLTRLRVRDRLGELEAGATWNLGGDKVNFHLRSSADLPGLALAVTEMEQFREFVFYEPVEFTADGSLLLGSAVPEGAFVPLDCVGSIRAKRFSSRGVVLDGLEVDYGISPRGCYLRDVLLRHETGTLGLQALWKKDESFRYRALLQMDPRVFLPFLKLPQTQEILRRFSFGPESAIWFEVEGEGSEPRIDRCQNHGRAEIHRFQYRGVDFQKATANVKFQGPHHEYLDLTIDTAEGRAVAKHVMCDDIKRKVTLTGVNSTVDPVALTSCFAPKTAEAIAKYRFDKHPHVELEGVIGATEGTDLQVRFRSEGTAHYPLFGEDYVISRPVGDLKFSGPLLTYDISGGLYGESMACKGTADLRPEANDYTVDFRADSFPYGVFGKALPFENLRATVTCKSGLVDFDTQSDLLDGRYRLRGKLDDNRNPQPYSGELRVDAISLNKFARVYSPKETSEGDLTGHLQFSGKLGDWRTLQGKGALVILNGNLYAVPILGPLTPLLGAMLPRPIKGYNIAKEGDCSFTVADGFAATEDFEALTGVFRLVVTGKVDFLEDRVQLEAKAKARGLPGLVLFPVSEILEYVGEGSVGSPEWRPKYFSGSKEKDEFRRTGEAPQMNESPKEPAPAPRSTRPALPPRK
ncbi:AsmA-like C-terminal region-containing protein [Roseimicrobium sp. ORNL1]|uniref:AsmA-like C-terminal region-containing protein n=1 Tax=Roseimicrobium sp. ORNL1 TaxID=2711231 RepID=UPI0013E1826E|nr:AsmA-like C-terminal region-containing protein [Roseimicrobium sp. ORNL1]QIF04759.1 AsmA-like C-terminal region-containing protein [Roseimicrobium sp. ORNL1]